jgi:hypothetical protein
MVDEQINLMINSIFLVCLYLPSITETIFAGFLLVHQISDAFAYLIEVEFDAVAKQEQYY